MIIEITNMANKCYNEAGLLHGQPGTFRKWPVKGYVCFENGLIHRLDGPAVYGKDDEDTYKTWNIKGIMLHKDEFNNWILRIKRIYNIRINRVYRI